MSEKEGKPLVPRADGASSSQNKQQHETEKDQQFAVDAVELVQVGGAESEEQKVSLSGDSEGDTDTSPPNNSAPSDTGVSADAPVDALRVHQEEDDDRFPADEAKEGNLPWTQAAVKTGMVCVSVCVCVCVYV
jgi:hypothetical protein